MYYVVTAKHKSAEENTTAFEYVVEAPNTEYVYDMAEDAGEEFFLALKSFNERQRYLRRLLHRKKKGKIDLDVFLRIMNGLVNCTEESDIENLLNKIE